MNPPADGPIPATSSVGRLASVPPRADNPSRYDSRRWVAEIDKVAFRPRTPSCLDRSVFLWFVLRINGIEGELRIGVAPNADTIDGHAWVEHDDVVINDEPDIAQRFAVFDDDPIRLVFS